MTLTSVAKAGPTASATSLTYERRRTTLLNLISMLSAAENTHHARCDALSETGGPRWKDCMDLGKAISEVGQALQTLGVPAAEVDALLKVMR